MSAKNPGPVLFTQFDTVVGFNPAPGVVGIRVGQVSGAINGTITLNTTFNTPPGESPFKSNGSAVVLDTDGDQILFDVAFTGTFSNPPLGQSVVFAAGSYTAVYTVASGTGKYSGLAGQSFNGVGAATQPNPPTTPIGAAFTQIFGTLKGQGPQPK